MAEEIEGGTNPLLVKGFTGRGTPVKVDVQRMCAEDPVIHAAVAKALARLLAHGFRATNTLEIGITLNYKSSVDSIGVYALGHDDLDVERYLVNFDYGCEAD